MGFDKLNLEKITARCDPENNASQKILKRSGMKYTHTLAQDLTIPRPGNTYRASEFYEISKPEWDQFVIESQQALPILRSGKISLN